MTASNLLAGLLFSGIGFIAFMYGKRMQRLRVMALGGALMAYPYFTSDALQTCAIGALLTALLVFWRE